MYMYPISFKYPILLVSLDICYVFILSQSSILMTELEPVQTPRQLTADIQDMTSDLVHLLDVSYTPALNFKCTLTVVCKI